MKNLFITSAILITIVFVALNGFFLRGQVSSNSPLLAGPLVMPTVVPLNTTTSISITIAIPGTAVIPSGVNLLRLSATGAPNIVGQMHDDGMNGDVAAGDGIYSLRLPFSAATTTLVSYQVSAAFKGVLRRVLSPTFQILASAVPPTLPPDPGTDGMQTLGGVDSDKDGVRDDVQRYIALAHPESARKRTALTQTALVLQSEILGASDPALSKANIQQFSYADDCLSSAFMISDADVAGGQKAYKAYLSLEALVLNTPARTRAFFQADSQPGDVINTETPYTQRPARCLIDPSVLPN